MQGLLVLVCVYAVLATPVYLDTELDELWQVYKQRHNKLYECDQEEVRRFIWEGHLRYIRRHNVEADLGLHRFRLGMNEHGDLTDGEYAEHMRGLISHNVSQEGSLYRAPRNLELPEYVDWREHGYVTPVKVQGPCGSCWAFSTTGSLEGQYFKKSGKLVSLSEQNLVDCSIKEGNKGCKGGIVNLAFLYVKQHGIASEDSYPYAYKGADVVTSNMGYVDITKGSESDLQKAVATVGPVSVAIDAGHPSFRFYQTGVYIDTNCSSTKLDHGMLVVGYGTENGQEYWLLKNSWGVTWGDRGYIKLARNQGNMCGIASRASFPLV